MSKTHLLELSEKGFWRRGAVQPAAKTLGQLIAILEGKAAIAPWPEVPWLAESEEQPVIAVSATKVMMLEMRHMTELEDKVAVAELEHGTAAAEVTEMSLLEVRDMPEPECELPVTEVTEVPRLERPRLPKEATVVEPEATVSQVQLRAGVP